MVPILLKILVLQLSCTIHLLFSSMNTSKLPNHQNGILIAQKTLKPSSTGNEKRETPQKDLLSKQKRTETYDSHAHQHRSLSYKSLVHMAAKTVMGSIGGITSSLYTASNSSITDHGVRSNIFGRKH